MEIYRQLWDAFSDIYFEEESHSYTDSLGTAYTSATGWIKQFEADSDWDMILERSAKKQKVPKDELKAKWDYNGEYARTLGTEIHSVMENLWIKKDYRAKPIVYNYDGMKEDFDFRKERCKGIFKKMKQIYIPIASELIVYDQPNGICGTIDFLCINKKTKKFEIIDWKTSKKFTTFNDYQKMKAPFNHLDDCNTNHYALQLSLYKYILEKYTDIKISKMSIYQIPGKENACPQIIDVFDLSSQIKDYIEGKENE